MTRWAGLIVCVVLGLALLFCGLQVPVHLRAVDRIVLQKAGMDTPSLSDGGLSLLKSNQLGPAQLFLAAGQSSEITCCDKLAEAVNELATQQPGLRISGGAETGSVGALLETSSPALLTNGDPTAWRPEPFTEFTIRSVNRAKALRLLQVSTNPLAQTLIQFRSLTNTVLFPPSASTAGQALDAAVSICGLLGEAGHLSTSLSNEVLGLGAEANRSWNPRPLEHVLMDVMSLGQRFNWGQLATLVAQIQDAQTLRILAELVQRGKGVPVLYSAVCLSGNATGVAEFLTKFGDPGMNDLRSSLGYGAGGVNELLHRSERLCDSRFCGRIATLTSSGKFFAFALDYSRRELSRALAAKWLLYLAGGFFLAMSLHFARRVTKLERPLVVRGFHLAREFLFALGFLLLVLLLSEPFLAQESQKGAFPFRLHLPTVGGAVPAGNPSAQATIMNQITTTTVLTMLLFFVLQTLLYMASLVKLAEIRRQRVPSRVKLKLLENEDHLFDAGLYLGFLGTIISFILVSLGVFKQPSLMAAYSSTSFGILFVVTFKVLHLRPARRHLLLEAEAESPVRVAPPIESAAAAPL